MKITKYVAPVSPLDAVFDRLGFGRIRERVPRWREEDES